MARPSAPRGADGTGYLFLLNHGPDERLVPLGTPGTDLLTGTEAAGAVTLAPLGAAVIRLPAAQERA
ncbi:Beta-galactosidase C-terminal domain [Kitasatospora sp. NPDC004799]|uniref:Beta-galactosidase C-terminal domain n=1 Tax=Kitasatospora sp. NPDC004799 TaxID=3154460 RepID=UPI0033AF8024